MKAYRTKYEIAREILSKLKSKEQTRTDIMYNCRLSWYQTTKYVERMLKSGWIIKNTNGYVITEKGTKVYDKLIISHVIF